MFKPHYEHIPKLPLHRRAEELIAAGLRANGVDFEAVEVKADTDHPVKWRNVWRAYVTWPGGGIVDYRLAPRPIDRTLRDLVGLSWSRSVGRVIDRIEGIRPD